MRARVDRFRFSLSHSLFQALFIIHRIQCLSSRSLFQASFVIHQIQRIHQQLEITDMAAPQETGMTQAYQASDVPAAAPGPGVPQQPAQAGYAPQPQPTYAYPTQGTAPAVGTMANRPPVSDWQTSFWDCFSPTDICERWFYAC